MYVQCDMYKCDMCARERSYAEAAWAEFDASPGRRRADERLPRGDATATSVATRAVASPGTHRRSLSLSLSPMKRFKSQRAESTVPLTVTDR